MMMYFKFLTVNTFFLSLFAQDVFGFDVGLLYCMYRLAPLAVIAFLEFE